MREFFNRLKAKPYLFSELLLASFFISLLALSSPIFVIQVLNRYVSNGVDSTLVTLTTGVLIAVALEFSFRQVRLKMARGVSVKPDAQLAGGAFATLTSAKTAAIERMPAALRREVMNGLASVQQAYSPANLTTVLDVPFALLYIVVLFLIKPMLAVIALSFMLAMFLFTILVHKLLAKPMQDLNQVSVRNNALVGSALLAADSVRSFNAAVFLKDAWGKQQALTNALRRKVVDKQGLSQSLTQSASAVMGVAIIAVGALYVVAGEMSVGAMIGANILASRALAPINRVAQLSQMFARARQALDLLERFMKLPREESKGSALKQYQGRLELKDLAFMHPGAAGPLFESVSLELSPGLVLVISGGNGTGKTTLARLLVGLLEPTRGQILIDGLDLRQVMPQWWRRQIIYLPQEPVFFDGTIRENLVTVNPDLKDARLGQIIERAGLKRFIDESSEGLETPIYNGGSNLALGIRRRFALARALVSDGRLVIFDEPAEGLDAEGGAMIARMMTQMIKNGRTLIVCSHNPKILQGPRVLCLNLDVKPIPSLVTTPVDKSKQRVN